METQIVQIEPTIHLWAFLFWMGFVLSIKVGFNIVAQMRRCDKLNAQIAERDSGGDNARRFDGRYRSQIRR